MNNGLVRFPRLRDVDFFAGMALGIASAVTVLVVLTTSVGGLA